MKPGRATILLQAHAAGDPGAMDELFPIVYGELRDLARGRMRKERAGHTLSATGLVHEAYLRLVGLDRIDWQNSRHFLAIASRVMRNVLVDHAQRKRAEKRGGGRIRIPIKDADLSIGDDVMDILAVDEALSHLASLDARQVRVVECRFFGGLTIDETAEALEVSPATVSRDWVMARAWLNRELSG